MLIRCKILLPLLLLLSTLGWGQTGLHSYTFTTTGQDPSASRAIPLAGTGIGYNEITWVTQGTVSSCAVQLDSSSNGSSWTGGGAISSQSCTSNGQSGIIAGVFNYVTINVTTLSGGGSLTVTWNGFVSSGSQAFPQTVTGKLRRRLNFDLPELNKFLATVASAAEVFEHNNPVRNLGLRLLRIYN